MNKWRSLLGALGVGAALVVANAIPVFAGTMNPNTGDLMGKYLPIVLGALVISGVALVIVGITSKKGKGKKRRK